MKPALFVIWCTSVVLMACSPKAEETASPTVTPTAAISTAAASRTEFARLRPEQVFALAFEHKVPFAKLESLLAGPFGQCQYFDEHAVLNCDLLPEEAGITYIDDPSEGLFDYFFRSQPENCQVMSQSIEKLIGETGVLQQDANQCQFSIPELITDQGKVKVTLALTAYMYPDQFSFRIEVLQRP